MGAKTKTGKGRLDKYYYLAKEQGYRSRAAFKLVQLNRKYGFLERARTLLDLCAAPGGWLQIAAKTMPMSSLIVGVDLAPIRPIRGCITLMEDITTQKCRAAVKRELKGSLLDVVLHDGSPNVGGAWSSEAYTQSALTLEALKLATELLVPGGTFVSKIFRSQDYNALLFALNQLFERVESTKPVASRNTSAEIYVVCQRYKAPAKIDPRLLDAKHLFQQTEETTAKPVDVLRESKQKRHREGYEDGLSLVGKVGSVSEFVKGDSPVEYLGTYHSLHFQGPEGQALLARRETDAEVRALCEDLKVLGKREFKALLKWRIAMRQQDKAEHEQAESDDEDKEEAAAAEEGAVDGGAAEEAAVLGEMAELRAAMEARKKHARKLAARKKEKAKARTSTGMAVDATGEDGVYADEELFNLRAIKSDKGLATVAPEDGTKDGEDEDDEESMEGGENERGEEMDREEGDDEMDEEAEEKRHLAMLEEYLETAYEEYQKRSGLKSKAADRRQRKRLAESESDTEEPEPAAASAGGSDSDSDSESEGEEGAGGNPLVVGLSTAVKPSKEQLAEQWFSQSVFQGVQGGQETAVERAAVKRGREPDTASESEDEDEEAAHRGAKRKKRAQEKASNGVSVTKNEGSANGAAEKGEGGGFEEVPAAASESSDSEDEADLDGYETDDKAETLAYACAMLRKKGREDVLDEAYNRYTFNDDDLPAWFKNEERKHMQPIKPVTKEEIDAFKAQFRSIDTRTPKKVAQAKARKRGRMLKKMEQVRQKANSIADGADMNNRSKAKMIEKLYRKAAPKHVKKEVAVTKSKGVGPSGAKGKLKVDRRMKADMRKRNTGGAVNRKGKLVGKGNRAKKAAPSKGGRANKGGAGEGPRPEGRGDRRPSFH